VGIERIPVLYLAPWVDLGNADRETVEWFKHIDRERWAASLITTQPSPNQELHRVETFAEEIWDLPDVMPGGSFPDFILGFIESRDIHLVHILNSRLGFDLLPDIACLPHPPTVVAQLQSDEVERFSYVQYVARRYGNLVDAFSVTTERLKETTVGHEIPPSRIEVIPAVVEGDAEQATRSYEGLYQRLLSARPASSRWRDDELFRSGQTEFDVTELAPPEQLKLPRSPAPERSVGVIVPCYRHGIFIDECIESIKMQTHSAAQIVVVDDGSDDPETIAAMARLDRDPDVEVIRQPMNRGPSAARNRGLEALETSYVLPIDADDKLFPDALEGMLAQLEAASEDVGFVYPHAQHFGNRTDYVRLPAYNLWLLMRENYCPSPALFDRRVFAENGVRYPEEIVVGHEDWDLVLQLGERGIHGIHSNRPTFLYRRQGFSRVNAADYGPHEFEEAIERRHPRLYRNSDRIKTEWAPALSLLLLDEDDVWRDEDIDGISVQSCHDFEILASTEMAGARVVKMGENDSPAKWLQEALREARGRWLCVLTPAAVEALRNPAFVELLLYGFVKRHDRYALALGVTTNLSRHSLAELDDSERLQAQPVGIAFERRAAISLPDVHPSGEPLLADLALCLQSTGIVQWRRVPAAQRSASAREISRGEVPETLQLGFDRSMDKSEFATRDLIAHEAPRLPEVTPGTARRWKGSSGWTPPGTSHLCRHLSQDGGHRIIANHRYSPPGYSLEFDLGAVHVNASPGMLRLVHADHSFELIEDQDALDKDRHGLGYVEQQPLPQLERLELRRMPESGEKILVAGPRDPLFAIAEPLAEFGWIEAFPLNPQDELPHTGPWRAIALKRHLPLDGRRHRYGVGGRDLADATDLGSLYPYPGENLVALRLRDDGRLASDLAQPGRASRDPRRFVRWIAAKEDRGARQAGGRLLYLATSSRGRRLAEDGGTVLGGLRRHGGPNLYPLFSTTHPVTGDQLVTCSPGGAVARGYLQDGVLGYIHLPWNRPTDLV
jgi:glycosyltransferase involved in cell wall biosynthesis